MSTTPRPKPNEPGLFDLSPDEGQGPERPPAEPQRGTPRLLYADRHQVVIRIASLDELLPDDHPARLVWEFVVRLDLSPLLERIRSVEGGPGRPATDPRVLMALWLYATIEGVGSARALNELCRSHVGFQWIAGDVPMNYHTLSDFRSDHADLLNDLLVESVAVLIAEGLVDFNRVAQDGARTRASAGAASFRRRPTLEEALQEANEQIKRLQEELENDPAGTRDRSDAAKRRAAADRARRVQEALDRLPEAEAKKPSDKKDQARASTTDADATVMKMADGGFRPAYNVQFATDCSSQIVLGVEVTTSGSDQGEMTAMADRLIEDYGKKPTEYLVDGGYTAHDEIVKMSEKKIDVYAPVPKPRTKGVDQFKPKPGEPAAVSAWRERMGTEPAKRTYKDRASTAECVNAQARQRGMTRFLVRGLNKARAVALWQALAHNLMRAVSLRNAKKAMA